MKRQPTPKQQRFAEAYAINAQSPTFGNATATYAATYAVGTMSRKTIRREAQALAHNPTITTFVAEMQQAQQASFELTGEWVRAQILTLHADCLAHNDRATAARVLDMAGRAAGIFERGQADVQPLSVLIGELKVLQVSQSEQQALSEPDS